ncbi:Uncharacterised protein [Mycobacteroides abscessus subsp. massiliense]|nr:Uncharacterised protein [Mycobacteroides abscessus subsp. massiliense]
MEWGQIKPSQAHRRVGKWGHFKPSYRGQTNLPQTLVGAKRAELAALDQLLVALSERFGDHSSLSAG